MSLKYIDYQAVIVTDKELPDEDKDLDRD